MFDASLRKYIDPPTNRVASWFVGKGISADQITLVGFFVGLMAVPALWLGYPLLALGFIAVNRCADGLDGAVARQTKPTDRGGFLDICLDFFFYSAVPFGFALMDPAQNALAACFLIFSFIGTGASFLAYAIFAEKRGDQHRSARAEVALLPRRFDRRVRNHCVSGPCVPVSVGVLVDGDCVWWAGVDHRSNPRRCGLADVPLVQLFGHRLPMFAEHCLLPLDHRVDVEVVNQLVKHAMPVNLGVQMHKDRA